MARVRTVTIIEDDEGHRTVILELGSERKLLGNKEFWVGDLSEAITKAEKMEEPTIAKGILDPITDYYVGKGYMSAESAERVKDSMYKPSSKGDSRERDDAE